MLNVLRLGARALFICLLLLCANLQAQTQLRADVYSEEGSSYPANLTPFGTALLFNAIDTTHGFELQSWDSSDTLLFLSDLQAGKEGGFPYALTEFMGQLYFSASDGINGHELWTYNGLSTSLVSDITGDSTSSWPDNFTEWGTSLYFTATDSAHGTELWRMNGTVITRITDLYPDTNDAKPNHLIVFGGKLLFTATDSAHGNEIWEYNGSTVSLVTDLNPGVSGSYASGFTEYNGELYFSATNGTTGHELWKYDGSSVTLVNDLAVGPGSSYPAYLTVYNGNLIFSAQDTVHGNEIWMYNGTVTSLVAEVNPGPAHAYPADFIAYDSALFFSATDGVHGFELWKTNGVDSVELVVDIYEGPESANPINLTLFNGELYFRANGDGTGAELWSYRPCKLPEQPELFVSDSLVCLNTEITISVANSDSLGDASYWVLYAHSLDSTAIDTSLTGDFTLSPTDSSSWFFVRGEGCDLPGVADSLLVLTYTSIFDTLDATICTGDTFMLDTQLLTSSGTYTALMTSAGSCDSMVVLNLTVNPTYSDTSRYTICAGDSLFLDTAVYTIPGQYVRIFSTNEGCDSTEVIELSVQTAIADSVQASICANETYIFGNDTLQVSGSYTQVFQSAAGCDSTVVLALQVLPVYGPDTVTVNLCAGETYALGSNVLSVSGWYSDTLLSQSGCDSVVVAHLNVWPAYNDTLYVSICDGESYAFGAQTLSISGIYSDTAQTTMGCDSNQTVVLTVNSTFNDTVTASICDGASYAFGALTLTAAGSYYDTLSSAAGCDSIVSLQLNVLPTFVHYDTVQICAGTNYTFNGSLLTTSGDYSAIFSSAAGCDSTVYLHFIVQPSYPVAIYDTICAGATYLFGGLPRTTSGTYVITNQTALGCDSSTTLTLTVLPVYNDSLSITLCQGETFLLGSQVLDSTGTYTATLQAAGGCDSLVYIDLTVNPTHVRYDTAAICDGDNYLLGPQVLTTGGNYSHTFSNSSGCDSVVYLSLTVLPEPVIYDTVFICSGTTFTLGSQVLSTSGDYTAIFPAANACDSTVYLHLEVLPVYALTTSAQGCAGDTFVLGTQTLTTTGSYTEVFQTAMGCDSTVTLNLTIAPNYAVNTTAEICDGETYQLGSQSLTTSGSYTATFQTAAGCDSVVNLSLTVRPTYHITYYDTMCSGEVYNFGNLSISRPGTYLQLFQSSASCDSSVTLNLTVNPSYNLFDTVVVCSGQSYSFGGALLTASGDYSYTYTAAEGCDSLVQLHFVVNPSYAHNDTVAICAGETYVFGPSTLNSTGDYVWNFQTKDGCDSIVALRLIVNPTYAHLDTVGICLGQSYSFGSQTLTVPGTYVEFFQSQEGCDSVVTLSFYVFPTYYREDTVHLCEGEAYSFGGHSLTVAGTYMQTFASRHNCDSTIRLELIVVPETYDTTYAAICAGESYLFGGQAYTSPGLFYDTLMNQHGCDSIQVLDLWIYPQFDEEITASICAGTIYRFGPRSLDSSGIYHEVFQSQHGCDSNVTLRLIAKKIDASVRQEGNTLIANNEDASYQWYRIENGAVPIAGATKQSLVAGTNGTYLVKVTEDFCAGFSDSLHVKSVGITGPLLEDEGIQLYPNPNKGVFSIAINATLREPVQAMIYGPSGQLIRTLRFVRSGTHSVALDNLPAGIYTVQFIHNGSFSAKKLIIY